MAIKVFEVFTQNRSIYRIVLDSRWVRDPKIISIKYGRVPYTERTLKKIDHYQILGCYDGGYSKAGKYSYKNKEHRKEIEKNSRFEFVVEKKLVFRKLTTDEIKISSPIINVAELEGKDAEKELSKAA